MPDRGWILVAVLAIVAITAIGIVVGARTKDKNWRWLRRRGERQPQILPLSEGAREFYLHEWKFVQSAFVDDPEIAVGAADRLITQVMRERGYPVDSFEQSAADLSVEDPLIVHSYRAAHHIRLAQDGAGISDEQQREAFVHFRALVEKLLAPEESTTALGPTQP